MHKASRDVEQTKESCVIFMKVGHFSLQDKDFKYKGFTLGCNMKEEMWMKKHWKEGEQTYI